MMERRELLKVLGAALVAVREGVAQHDHGTSAAIDIESYKPRFFSHQQYRAIDALTETIIPTDDQSPGAHAAGVRLYHHTVVPFPDSDSHQRWDSRGGPLNHCPRGPYPNTVLHYG